MYSFSQIDQCNTISQILQWRAKYQPYDIAYRYLLDGELKVVSINYQELHRCAYSIALKLKQLSSHLEPPQLALLLYPSGLEFIAAFFGCLYADVIAVPASIPRNIRSATRVQSILSDSKAQLILTDSATHSFLSKASLLEVLNIDKLLITGLDMDNPPDEPSQLQDENSIAFIQYTSGSTSTPKGVMISHANIIANQAMIKIAFNHSHTTIFAGWLPLFHDMGLIGNILHPLYLGIPSILMSPVAFLQKPIRWLQSISRYKATTSGAPNFAFDLCVEKIKEEEKRCLDLSSWQIAFNGSEPIHANTLERFTKAFSSCGFNNASFYPCYGLAEATLFVTGPVPQKPLTILKVDKEHLEHQEKAILSSSQDGKVSEIVNCGTGWLSGKVITVNINEKKRCTAFHQGEIWVQGNHIGLGYWGRPEQTNEVFRATLPEHEGYFLRTGDLGFIDDQNRLFITGRLKDIIIIRGRNIHPQDIELTVEECNDAICKHGCAAFCIQEKEEECLIIVAEVARDKLKHINSDLLVNEIRHAVSSEQLINPSKIILIKPNTLPKTSSGKIQRTLCKLQFLSGSLDVIDSLSK